MALVTAPRTKRDVRPERMIIVPRGAFESWREANAAELEKWITGDRDARAVLVDSLLTIALWSSGITKDEQAESWKRFDRDQGMLVFFGQSYIDRAVTTHALKYRANGLTRTQRYHGWRRLYPPLAKERLDQYGRSRG